MSSPWVRVMTGWAGSRFGQISVPRVGMEVVVQFIEGNLSRPLIIGAVYNEYHMPPWPLPDNKTQSGILTRSTKGGTDSTANALRFEDAQGAEELWLHAEKDQRIEVEHDESHWVGHDRRKNVDHDETVVVKNNRTETVGHDETITVHNDRSERVDHNEKISIGGNRAVQIHGMKSERVALAKEETIGLGKALTIGALYQTSVGGAMNTTVAMSQAEEIGLSKTVIVGQTSALSAGIEHTIVVGSSMIKITATRIEIIADEVVIQGRTKVQIHGDDIDNNPGGG
jgi:type VI secretion system secreted protein VgrG